MDPLKQCWEPAAVTDFLSSGINSYTDFTLAVSPFPAQVEAVSGHGHLYRAQVRLTIPQPSFLSLKVAVCPGEQAPNIITQPADRDASDHLNWGAAQKQYASPDELRGIGKAGYLAHQSLPLQSANHPPLFDDRLPTL